MAVSHLVSPFWIWSLSPLAPDKRLDGKRNVIEVNFTSPSAGQVRLLLTN